MTEKKVTDEVADLVDAKDPDAKPKEEAETAAKPPAVVAWGFPSFARDFPANEELSALGDAFARGDYKTAGEGGRALAKRVTEADIDESRANTVGTDHAPLWIEITSGTRR